MLDRCVCKRDPDIQKLGTTIASQSTYDRFAVTMRRPTAVLFRFSTILVDAANVINPDIQRHVIVSTENGRNKALQTREHLPHLIINKNKCGWKTMPDYSACGIRDQFCFLSGHNKTDLEIPFLNDLLSHHLKVRRGHRIGLHVSAKRAVADR